MPTLQPEDHQDAFSPAAGAAAGILEGADGVTRLHFLGRELAFAPVARVNFVKGTYHIKGETYCIEWRRWFFESLYWTHTTALLRLQGASLQQALPPWLVLRGEPLPAPCPTPGATNVVLAEFGDLPPLTQRQLFELLLPDAGGACAPTPF